MRIFWPVVQAAETAYVVPSAVLGRAPTTLADRFNHADQHAHQGVRTLVADVFQVVAPDAALDRRVRVLLEGRDLCPDEALRLLPDHAGELALVVAGSVLHQPQEAPEHRRGIDVVFGHGQHHRMIKLTGPHLS